MGQLLRDGMMWAIVFVAIFLGVCKLVSGA